MISRFITSCLTGLCLVYGIAGIRQPAYCVLVTPQEVSASKQDVEPASPDQSISLDLSNTTLADVVESLGHKYGIPILADSFVNDSTVKTVKFENTPLKDVIRSLAKTYNRDTRYVNGIIVLRASILPLKVLHEASAMKVFNYRWPDAGLIKAGRYKEADDAEGNEFQPSGTLEAPSQEKRQDALQLPARFIFLEAKNAPLWRVISAVQNTSKWVVDGDVSLTERRMSACLHHVTPGQVLEAITYLLNASQRIVIEQTDAQKRADAATLDFRPDRLKRSEALLSRLASALTDEQRRSFVQGNEVALGIGSMPLDLRSLAEDYALHALSANSNVIDASRLNEFSIVFIPGSPTLGVNGFAKGGSRMFY